MWQSPTTSPALLICNAADQHVTLEVMCLRTVTLCLQQSRTCRLCLHAAPSWKGRSRAAGFPGVALETGPGAQPMGARGLWHVFLCVRGSIKDFNQLIHRKKTHCAIIPGSNKHTAKPIKEHQSNLPSRGYGMAVCVCDNNIKTFFISSLVNTQWHLTG